MNLLLSFLHLFIFAPFFVRSLNLHLNDDVLGLIIFKADIEDPKGRLKFWNEDDSSPCGWVGVKCDNRTGRVSELALDDFSLSGKIGRGLLQLQFLKKLSLSKNNLTGSIAPNLTVLVHLRDIDLSENTLSGSIPGDFFLQCGSLRAISVAKNNFSGEIPSSLSSCARLISVNFSSNQFSGSLPSGIWSLKGLRSLDLSDNLLEGDVPKGIEAMVNLRVLSLRRNQFIGQVPDGIGSCYLLKKIDLSVNSFSGSLPDTMQKLALCNYLSLHNNSILGDVPEWIGEMKSLETLDLSHNRFSGNVPNSTANLKSLKLLDLSMNALTGSLPVSMANCTNLLSLNVGHNAFSGEIAPEFRFLSRLGFLNLSWNNFSGPMPTTVGEMKALVILDLSENVLNGSIPLDIGGASSLKELRLRNNFLSGKIPSSLGNCSSLTSLILSNNNLTGPIPASIAKLANLKIVDLSFNNLTGTLPKKLSRLRWILSFNISNNNICGELPPGAFFDFIPPSSVSGNPLLCGAVVNHPCHHVHPKPIVLDPDSSPGSTPVSLPPTLRHQKIVLSVSALVAIGAAAVIVLGVIFITVLNLSVRSSAPRPAAALMFSGEDDFSRSPTAYADSGKLVMFSGDPEFSAGTHALLNKDCELGRGGFGAVYRTVLQDGRPVAIKKLTVSSLVKSQEDFEREVRKLGNIRHLNLVALEGYYWTSSLQLLIYEFVPGGSLHKRLHEESDGGDLSWNERYDTILGVARSLAYLHQKGIIHYNLKSSNVLIDGSGEPKVGDFGLARLLPMLDRYVLSGKVQSALGYMAPEFACRAVKVTEKCDVYGFGVLVLEVVSGRRPVEYMEDDVVVLCDMVRGALEEGRVEECIDERLLGRFPAEEAIPVMKLGLICTSQVPSNRPDMGEVVHILELIRCPSEGQEELI